MKALKVKDSPAPKAHTPGPWVLSYERLIAAAPEMLEALKTALEFIDAGGMGDGVNAHAKATIEQYLSRAIAKATGGEE